MGVRWNDASIARWRSLRPGVTVVTPERATVSIGHINCPHGVGAGLKPPVFLKDGDVVTLGISGLGEQRQEARAWAP